jgi:galactokinase
VTVSLDGTVEAAVVEEFRHRFGTPPEVIVRAPGRVNVIGEHTDYSLLPVMPMAIQRALIVAASRAEGEGVRAHSLGFGDAELTDHEAGWGRYVAAALPELQRPVAANIMIGGDLPAESGLSSSAALTTGVLAAISLLAGLDIDGDDLVRRAIAAEHRVGVRSGGMDQTVVVHGKAGSLLRIDFDPPSRRNVPIPDGLVLVVASSGARAAKAGEARQRYNGLVVGARLAAIVLSRALLPHEHPHLSAVRGRPGLALQVEKLPESASLAQIGVAPDAWVSLDLAGFSPHQAVPLAAAARHALGEADRVDAAEDALSAGHIVEFGAILDASHASLRDDLRCSTESLDRLCAAMRRAGAVGARLTGAGFGGYAVAAVPLESVEAVLAAAISATGGPAFVAEPSQGLSWT